MDFAAVQSQHATDGMGDVQGEVRSIGDQLRVYQLRADLSQDGGSRGPGHHSRGKVRDRFYAVH